MNRHLFVLIVSLVAVVYAQDDTEQAAATNVEASRSSGLSDAQIRRILEENSQTLRQIDIKTNGISNSQKGIESKLRALGQDVAGIDRLEDNLKRLERVTAGNFQVTANSIRDLSNSIRAAENRTDRAIASLSRGQQDIKQALVRVDQNQNRYERNLDEVAKSVHLRLAGLDNLLRQSVLKELAALSQTARKLEQSQRLIESKVVRLDELTKLSGITASKVQQLEQGLRSINSTTQRQLAAIGQGVQQVGTHTWQIDNKLGVLLSTQKNIERGVVECKKCQPQPQPHKDRYPQEHYSGHQQIYNTKDLHRQPSKPEYESSYANPDEASYLYQLFSTN